MKLTGASVSLKILSMRALALGVSLALPCGAWAQESAAPSGIRPEIRSASVTGLDCRRRAFEMEYTRSALRVFPALTRGMIVEGLDPRPILSGLAAVVLMIPLTALAVPGDLAASPFRRECGFTVRVDGALVEWAGGPAPGTPVEAEGVNLLRPGLEGSEPPRLFRDSASAVAGEGGLFSLSLKGRMARSKQYDLHWRVRGSEAGVWRLRKSGRRFRLYELDAGFGTGIYEPREFVIVPK